MKKYKCRLDPIRCYTDADYINAINLVIDTYHMCGKLSIDDICAIQHVVGMTYGKLVAFMTANWIDFEKIKI